MAGVIVTGAFGALGSAVVSHLAELGHFVAAVDMAPTSKSSGATIDLGGTDLFDLAAINDAYASAEQALCGVTALVNVAGGFVFEAVEAGSSDTWDRMYATNLRTCVNSCRSALPYLLRGGGAIVNVGAAVAANPGAGMGAYAASKSGVVALTQSLAVELRDRNVRVNAILPTIVDTPANRKDMPNADKTHWVHPVAAARVIAFLLSDEAAAITGAAIPLSLTGKS